MTIAKRIPRLPNPASTCFFLCDLQERFRSIIHACPQVIQTANKLVRASEILQIPLIVTEHYPKALGSTFPEININSASLVAEKTKFSMWIPKVEDHVKSLNTQTVVLFGIESHVCILQTTLDLLRNDIEVYLVLDGISSCNQPEMKVAVERMREAGAFLTTSESILFQLMGDATHKNFKEISGLIKETKSDTLLGLTKLVSNL
ncbi:Isochorismatase domain-containing protein 1 [Boothiomyces sp. JEL0866]|nr:Isochorismatase domain-containing protein 1 [Boothiomyces sp. JEL0866]